MKTQMTRRAFGGKCGARGAIGSSDRLPSITGLGRPEHPLLLQQAGQPDQAEAAAGTAQELAAREVVRGVHGRLPYGGGAESMCHAFAAQHRGSNQDKIPRGCESMSPGSWSIYVNKLIHAQQRLAEIDPARCSASSGRPPGRQRSAA